MAPNDKAPQLPLEGPGDASHVETSIPDLTFDEWRDAAEVPLSKLAASGRAFTAYDLTLAGALAPKHPNWWGLLFGIAHRAGIIVPVGYTASGRRSRAGGACHVWVGAESLAGGGRRA